MAGQAVLSRLFSLVVQFALAKILLPEDFGLVALTLSAGFIGSFVTSSGIKQFIISRGRTSALWMGYCSGALILLGLLGASLVMLLGYLLSGLYDQDGILLLFLITSFTILLDGLLVTPLAALQVSGNFGVIARYQLSTSIGTSLLSLAFAYLGQGAISILLPRLLLLLVGLPILYRVCPFKISPQFSAFKFRVMISRGSWFWAAFTIYSFITQIPAFVLGTLHGPAAAGTYFFASSVTSQSTVLITSQLEQVLFPALAEKKSDPAAQATAYCKSLRMLVILCSPLCGCLATFGPYLLIRIFDQKWSESANLLSILAIASMFLSSATPSGVFIQSSRHPKVYFAFSVAMLLSAVALLPAGGLAAAGLGVGIAYCLHSLLGSVSCIWVSLTGYPNLRREVLVFFTSVWSFTAVLAGAISLYMRQYPSDLKAGALFALFSVIYISFSYTFMRSEFGTLVSLARSLLNQSRNSR